MYSDIRILAHNTSNLLPHHLTPGQQSLVAREESAVRVRFLA
jgi:hypothetical protein